MFSEHNICECTYLLFGNVEPGEKATSSPYHIIMYAESERVTILPSQAFTTSNVDLFQCVKMEGRSLGDLVTFSNVM